MFTHFRNLRMVLVAVAIFIAIATLLTSNYLIKDLQQEEKNRMEVWAEAMRSLNNADENTDLILVLKVINGNNTIPVIVVDKEGTVQTYRNLDVDGINPSDSVAWLKQKAEKMKAAGRCIRIYPSLADSFDDSGDGAQTSRQVDSDDSYFIEICYDESLMLRRLALYPYIQLGVMILFVGIAIFALFSSMKAEQNKVWVGLSKETAHQLGTPISSLMAWVEVLRETYATDPFIPEMQKDVQRLERIAERFSKIGSIPEPKSEDIVALVERVVEYMDKRTSSKVLFTVQMPNTPVQVMLISSLFEWVLENLCKNAVDAMSGCGKINIVVQVINRMVVIEVTDTGKGMPKSNFKRVFKPGFTTKSRGWGLGLSLAKRIVEQYHRGRIFVKASEIGHGTTFRVELPVK